MHQYRISSLYVIINLFEQSRKKKDNVRIKVFTYPRSPALKFVSIQADPYSHRAMITNDCTQSYTTDENSPLPLTYGSLLDRNMSRTDNRNGVHFTDNLTAQNERCIGMRAFITSLRNFLLFIII